MTGEAAASSDLQARGANTSLINFEGKRHGETAPTVVWLAAESLAARPAEWARVFADADNGEILLSDNIRLQKEHVTKVLFFLSLLSSRSAVSDQS